jgi:hypothetical protein
MAAPSGLLYTLGTSTLHTKEPASAHPGAQSTALDG